MIFTTINVIFVFRPIAPYLKPTGITVHYNLSDMEQAEEYKELPYRTQTHGTQTDYRDSETQTSPWAPPVLCNRGTSPEILTLASLSWGKV